MGQSIKPLGYRVLAKQDKSSDKTASGLYIAEGAKEKPEIAEIVAVGDKVKDVKVGDKVLYKKYSPPVKVDGEEYLVLSTDHDEKDGDIVAVITK